MSWERVKQWARNLKRDVVALWIAARDPRTPWYAKAAAGAVAAYALSPIDLIPDFIPILGYLDELFILPIAIALTVRLVPADLMAEFRRTAAIRERKPYSILAAVVIVSIWMLALFALAYLAYRMPAKGLL
ncbi:putative transmembrane protein (plasmid) [Sinorhizobium fredii NGR234]|uniref:Transmembrane protein n=1 Tax=Sinorhizobium fredii (strain NBRC 101917 / NGR234) TaxID=394 RepID=C3KKD5_SINFN|nr:YkvA family protein [Sinorhizobium fredii]ACP22871.1 putative transmembrane protein [Sinorhizobium fredii NGR234]